jgi:hypothetical protein
MVVIKTSLEWLSGGLANTIATIILNPMDVTKTRMQTLHATNTYKVRFSEVFHSIYRAEGIIGLWTPGLAPTIARQMLYSGPAAGFYVPVRDWLKQVLVNIDSTKSEDSFALKVCSALITGTLGSLIANPADVIKVRTMVEPHAYPSLTSGFIIILRNEGIRGLYKGLIPSTLRGD